MTILQGRSEEIAFEAEADYEYAKSTSIKYEVWYLGVWWSKDACGTLSAEVMYEIGSREETDR